MKYARDGVPPRVDIWTERNNNVVKIYYSDNGAGIDTVKYKDQLFGLYKRFDYRKSGKGMGMFLIKSQVEALDGSIEIESEIGVGTKFLMSFPLAETD